MIADVFPRTPPGAKVFRSPATRFFGWAWMVFAAANLIDIALRGRDLESLVAAMVMLLGCGVAYAFALRPRIVADETAVRFHNLVRDVHLPWAAVDRVEGGDAVYVHAGGRRFRAFVLQTSPRSRAKFEMKARRADKRLPDAVADYVKGRTPTDFAADQIKELAERHGRTTGDRPGPAVQWSWPSIAGLLVPGLAFIVALAVALS